MTRRRTLVKTPERCPECGSRTLELVSITSRVYALWKCLKCASTWRADASSAKLITRLTTREAQQAVAGQ